MIIAIDFDGTCVTHEFPKIGKDIGAIPVLKELLDNGHQLILYTMRSDMTRGEYTSSLEFTPLESAVEWFKYNKIRLFGINKNPSQHTWTASPKVYAHLYIDDAALGIPLKQDKEDERPYVDWVKVRELLVEQNIIK